MHQKKSQVEIGKESTGVSSDFNPTIIHQYKNLQQHILCFQSPPDNLLSYTSESNPPHIIIHQLDDDLIAPTISPSPKTAAHKRPLTVTTQFPSPSSYSPSKTPILSNIFHNYSSSSTPPAKKRFPRSIPADFQLLHRLRVHLGLVFLLSLPFFYFILSHPSHSFLLDFLSAFAFVSVLVFFLSLALPRLPSIRFFFSQNFPINFCASRSLLLRIWSTGLKSSLGKRANSGYCVQTYSNGDVYQGEFHKGKSSGNGVYYYHMSGKYEGDWIDGKYDGYGVETWARGSQYRGQYKLGLRHGFGVYRFYTGDIYAGEWANGQSHKCGVHTCEDGSRYVGEFKWGVKHGLGYYHFRNGDKYTGEYFSDKMHGFGVYTFAKGHRYEGGWHKGRRQGLGMYTFRDGETQSGNWENGVLSVPSTQNSTYPISPVAVYHSKVLNAVQEARRAAEKAYDVAKVDERVSRAVASANSAADASRVAALKAVQKATAS